MAAKVPAFTRYGLPQALPVLQASWTALTTAALGWVPELGATGHIALFIGPADDGEEVGLVWSLTDPGSGVDVVDVPLVAACKARTDSNIPLLQPLLSFPVARGEVEAGYWWVRSSADVTVAVQVLGVTEQGD
jgi:hypothetical protein